MFSAMTSGSSHTDSTKKTWGVWKECFKRPNTWENQYRWKIPYSAPWNHSALKIWGSSLSFLSLCLWHQKPKDCKAKWVNAYKKELFYCNWSTQCRAQYLYPYDILYSIQFLFKLCFSYRHLASFVCEELPYIIESCQCTLPRRVKESHELLSIKKKNPAVSFHILVAADKNQCLTSWF